MLSSGIGGACSRLRFGDGYASEVGGISPNEVCLSYMGAVVTECEGERGGESGVIV